MNKLVTTLESSYVVWIHLFLYSPWSWMQPLPSFSRFARRSQTTHRYTACVFCILGFTTQTLSWDWPVTHGSVTRLMSMPLCLLKFIKCRNTEGQNPGSWEHDGKSRLDKGSTEVRQAPVCLQHASAPTGIILSCFFYGTFWLLFLCGIYFYVLYVSLTPTAWQAKGWASSESLTIGKLVLVGIFH